MSPRTARSPTRRSFSRAPASWPSRSHNVATIDSDETQPDDAASDVFVPVVPLAETAPPTDVIASDDGPSAPGFSLMLILAVLGGLILVIGFVTPVPEVVRRRNRR